LSRSSAAWFFYTVSYFIGTSNALSDVGSFKILPDSQTILYLVWVQPQGWSLFKKTLDGNDITPLPFTKLNDWVVSPDGKMIAYSVTTNKGQKIRVSGLDENKPTMEFDFGNYNEMVWTKNGKGLLYSGNYKGHNEVILQLLDGGEAKPVTNFNRDGFIWGFDVSPDGKKIIARHAKQYVDIMFIKLNLNN